MSLSLGADVKVVVMLDFFSMRLSCGPISGMYGMQTYDFCSSSLARSTHWNGSSLKRDRFSVSALVEGWSFLFFFLLLFFSFIC